MAGTVRRVAVERGVDPRDFELVAFGGAGPLHAAEIAASLGMAGVIVPPHPGLASALGTLLADRRVDRRWTHYARSDSVDIEALGARLEQMEREARAALAAEGFDGEPAVVRSLSLRYAGQNYEREVPLPPGTVDEQALAGALSAFHELHRQVYGYSFPGETLELIHANVAASGPGERPPPATPSKGTLPPPRQVRAVRFPEAGAPATPVYRRDDLPAGAVLRGPRRDRGARLDDARPPRPGAEGAPGRHPPALGSVTDAAPRPVHGGDGVTLSVIGDQLVQIAQEMGTHMMRAAYSPIFSESRDFSCALFDREGRMIAQGRFNPAHLGAIGETVRCVLDETGPGSFEPGDVVIHNDPFRGGCHMPEHMLLRPVFYAGRARRVRRHDRPYGRDRRRHRRLVREHRHRGVPGGAAAAAGQARAGRRAGRGHLEDHPLEPPHPAPELGRPARDDRLARARRPPPAGAARPLRRERHRWPCGMHCSSTASG